MGESKRKVNKIEIDKGACIGAATCLAFASKAFQLDKEGVVELLPTAMEHTDEELLQAAQSCPTQAIRLLDENGNQL